MSTGKALDLSEARRRASKRRTAGVATDFDPSRLALARRLSGLQRSKLARSIDVTAAAISQYEKGQSRPTVPVVDLLAQALNVPPEFFRAGYPVPGLSATGAHFRSLRSTTAVERERALAFAELSLALFASVEEYVDLPIQNLPALDVPAELTLDQVPSLARQARHLLGVPVGPVPNMVRLLEAQGVLVVRLNSDDLDRVDAFSHHQGRRPIILLNPSKNDKARSRFDAAHELGHLLMHHDTEPGSRLVEQQAHAFAAEFLVPASEIVDELPTRLDWVKFQELKRRWGVSLKALVVRAKTLDRLSEHSYLRALKQLAIWGYPEPGSLGGPEQPVLLARSLALMGGSTALSAVALEAGIPESIAETLWDACGGAARPVVAY